MMKILLSFLSSILIVYTSSAQALTCPDQQARLPHDEIGISFLLVCHDPKGFGENAAVQITTTSNTSHYNPQSFSSYRDAANFNWKYPAIIWNKQSIKTEWHRGYVTLDDGTLLEGQLQLKVVQGELDDIKLKVGKKKAKFKFKQVNSFGLDPLDSFHEQIQPTFSQGEITLTDGTALKGSVRFINTDRMLFDSSARNLQLSPADIEEYTNTNNGERYISAQGAFAKISFSNASYHLAINPHPTLLKPKNNASNFFKNALKQVAVEQLSRSVAKGIASTGGSLNSALIAYDVTNQATQAYMLDPKKYRQEVFLVDVSAGETLLVHPDNLHDIFNPMLKKCEPFTSLPISEQVDAMNMENLEKLVTALAQCRS